MIGAALQARARNGAAIIWQGGCAPQPVPMRDMNSKQKFLGLDGLRGVAAILVMLFHSTKGAQHWFPLGAVAVDVFFALSGFVIAHSYATRMPTIGFKGFALARLIRLYPMYAVGTLVGIAVTIATAVSPAPPAVCGVTAALFLPCLAAPMVQIFPFNGPAWSLFFELTVNGVWALRRWTTSLACIVSVICGVVFVGLTLYMHTPGGFGLDNWWAGLPRVGFSYFLGVALHGFWSAGKLPRVGPFHWLAPVLLVLALMPWVTIPRYLFDVVVVTPVLIVMAVSREPTGRLAALYRWLGAVSYPIYVIHEPVWDVLRAQFGFTLPPVIILCGSLAILGAGSLLLRVYDEPVRAWLSDQARGLVKRRPVVEPADPA